MSGGRAAPVLLPLARTGFNSLRADRDCLRGGSLTAVTDLVYLRFWSLVVAFLEALCVGIECIF